MTAVTGGVIVPDWLFIDGNLTPLQKWVYLCLMNTCVEKGSFTGTFQQIREAMSFDGAISDVLGYLQMKGHITMEVVGQTKNKVPRSILKISIVEHS